MPTSNTNKYSLLSDTGRKALFQHQAWLGGSVENEKKPMGRREARQLWSPHHILHIVSQNDGKRETETEMNLEAALVLGVILARPQLIFMKHPLWVGHCSGIRCRAMRETKKTSLSSGSLHPSGEKEKYRTQLVSGNVP